MRRESTNYVGLADREVVSNRPMHLRQAIEALDLMDRQDMDPVLLQVRNVIVWPVVSVNDSESLDASNRLPGIDDGNALHDLRAAAYRNDGCRFWIEPCLVEDVIFTYYAFTEHQPSRRDRERGRTEHGLDDFIGDLRVGRQHIMLVPRPGDNKLSLAPRCREGKVVRDVDEAAIGPERLQTSPQSASEEGVKIGTCQRA